jgi:hypothetical protein
LFSNALRNRPQINLQLRHSRPQGEKNDDDNTTISFPTTILTPNRRELDVLYQNVCKQAHLCVKNGLSSVEDYQKLYHQYQSTSTTLPFLWSSHDQIISILQLPQLIQPPGSCDDNKSDSNDDSILHLFKSFPTTLNDNDDCDQYQPPTIVSDPIANKAIALARYLNNVTILVKLENDLITNGHILTCVGLPQTSPRRCGGQGDITAGLISGFLPTIMDIYNRFFTTRVHSTDQQQQNQQESQSAPPTESDLHLLNLISAIFLPYYSHSLVDTNATDLTTIQLENYSKQQQPQQQQQQQQQSSSSISSPRSPFDVLLTLNPPILAALLSSITLKMAALSTYQQHYTATTADKIIDQLPQTLFYWHQAHKHRNVHHQ